MKRSEFSGCAITAALAAVLGTAVLGVSACGSGTGPSNAQSPTPSATATAGESLKGIPFYRPSSVRSHTGSTAMLSSPDPVRKVSEYYVDVMHTGGWTTVSKSVTSRNGNLTIKKSGQGATISVAPSGSGSMITISTYPTA